MRTLPSVPTQHCSFCRDHSPSDALFCIHCGNPFSHAATGPTVHLNELAKLTTIALPPKDVRTIACQHWRALIFGIAIFCVGLLMFSNLVSQRTRTTLPLVQPLTSTTFPLSASDPSLPETSPYNFEILANGYLEAMQRQDIPVAAAFIAQKAITEEQRDDLLGEKQYHLIDGYISFGFNVLNLRNENKTGRVWGHLLHPACGVRNIDVSFTYEDRAWRIVSFKITEDPNMNEERKQQLCAPPTNGQ